MKYVVYFCIAFGFLLWLQPSESISKITEPIKFQTKLKVDSTIIKAINEQLPVNINVTNDTVGVNPDDLIKYLLDTLGAFLCTLILAFLHKKFPKIFTSSKPKDYTFK